MKQRISLCGFLFGVVILVSTIGNSSPQAEPVPLQKSGTAHVMVQSSSEDTELGLHSLSAVLMDADSGRVLYSKDSDVFRPMASTTKIMTCILALENGSLRDVCTVSEEAASQPKVHLGAARGRQFYMEDLLYSLMLESHNDSAVMIAEQIGGSVEGFARMMNQKARDIGCTETNFVTPNGLDATAATDQGTEFIHGTTAEDLARIMQYCITVSPMKDEFLTITGTANYSFTDLDGKQSYHCTNHNALLTMMPGALSGKTGFTNGAGYSYVGALENEGRTYIIALLASGWPPHKTYKWADAQKLFRYGMEEFHYRDVFEDLGTITVPVADGIPRQGEEQAAVGLTLGLSDEEKVLQMLIKDTEEIRIRRSIPNSLEAPVQKMQVVGSMDYYLNDTLIRSWPVFAAESVKKRSVSFYMQEVIKAFLMHK